MCQHDEMLPTRLVKVKAAAWALGISRSQLYTLLREGKVRSVHIGRARLIPVTALDEYVSGLAVGANYAGKAA